MKKLLILTAFLLSSSSVLALDDTDSITTLNKQITECRQEFLTKEQECPESWSMKCYDYLINLNHQTQNCYLKIANEIYQKHYSQNVQKAESNLKNYVKLTYEQYLRTYSETDFCIQNNCGISPYLYSEYATTQTLEFYINKLLNFIKANQ